MEIKIKTITPIWTGDIDRKCEPLKETGIIGSLRWWYWEQIPEISRL